MKNAGKCLLIVVNDPAFFLSHRLPIALAALENGFKVHVATPYSVEVEVIKKHGLVHHVISLSRSGSNPFHELLSMWSIWRVIKDLNPDILHLVTIKPILYGGVIARLARVPGVVIAVSGLGSVFYTKGIKASALRFFAKGLYRLVLGHKNLIAIFQNPNDRNELVKLGMFNGMRAVVIRGSGVSLEDYPSLPESSDIPVIVFAARLVRDKGIYEFVDAARQLHKLGIRAKFQVVGASDTANQGAVSKSELELWRQEGIVELTGFRTDISEVFAAANIVVLPSYHEGLPKVLIEAAACGRAVITTDHPGCRYAIVPDVTGLMVPVRNSAALANAIKQLLDDDELRHGMGVAGRALAESEFSIDKVITEHLTLYKTLVKE